MSPGFDPTLVTTVDEEVADELQQAGFSYFGELVACGFIPAPDFKKASGETYGHKVHDTMFIWAWKPLNFRYDTNPDSLTFERQGNYRVEYINYQDKNGNTIGPNSKFGIVKAALTKLGYKLRNKTDAQALIGKKFRVVSSPRKFFAPEGQEAPDIWTDLPVEELPSDWTYTGVPQVRQRAYETATAAERVEDKSEAIAKLVPALDGKEPKEFMMAIIGTGLESPWVDWAINGGQRLIQEMEAAGMEFSNGKLVASNGVNA